MSEKMIKTLHCAFLVIVGIVFILPLLWVVIASLARTVDLQQLQ